MWTLLTALAIAGAPPEATAPATAGFDHSHSAFRAVLAGAVSDTGVDYKGLAAKRPQLDAYLQSLATADAKGFNRNQTLALWVNAYNAYTIQLILDEKPRSITDLDGGNVWKTRTWTVAGEALTLDQLEHQRARPISDGRVHAVLNCASKGCPPLYAAPLDATKSIDPQLETAAKRWVRTNAYTLDGTTVALSSIFDWFGEDFGTGDKQANAVAFIQRYTDDATDAKLDAATTRTWAEYDWSLNQR